MECNIHFLNGTHSSALTFNPNSHKLDVFVDACYELQQKQNSSMHQHYQGMGKQEPTYVGLFFFLFNCCLSIKVYMP
jgi:hypothetical protein